MAEALGGVSNGVVYALLVVAVVQVSVQVWALVDLVRRERVAGGRKWVWAVVIIALSNLALGAILYFAIGRKAPLPVEQAETADFAGSDRAARAVDALYGSGKEDGR